VKTHPTHHPESQQTQSGEIRVIPPSRSLIFSGTKRAYRHSLRSVHDDSILDLLHFGSRTPLKLAIRSTQKTNSALLHLLLTTTSQRRIIRAAPCSRTCAFSDQRRATR
jgi:hypothetical protein